MLTIDDVEEVKMTQGLSQVDAFKLIIGGYTYYQVYDDRSLYKTDDFDEDMDNMSSDEIPSEYCNGTTIAQFYEDAMMDNIEDTYCSRYDLDLVKMDLQSSNFDIRDIDNYLKSDIIKASETNGQWSQARKQREQYGMTLDVRG